MAKRNIINVEGTPINITSIKDEDYISLTDMAGGKDDGSRAADVIKNWIRNRATIEFLGTWETMYNPNFKVVEFDHFKKDAGLPTFTMSVSNWVDNTNAKGIFSVKGRYGGTYAHKDIAFEFGSAISPVFKLYIIKEYQRLKEIDISINSSSKSLYNSASNLLDNLLDNFFSNSLNGLSYNSLLNSLSNTPHIPSTKYIIYVFLLIPNAN